MSQCKEPSTHRACEEEPSVILSVKDAEVQVTFAILVSFTSF